MIAQMLRKQKMKESLWTASGGRGSSSGCLRIGINPMREVNKGTTAFKKR